MKTLTKAETKKVLEIFNKRLNTQVKIEDKAYYRASSKFGELKIGFDLNDEVPCVFTRLNTNLSGELKQESVQRDFGEYSGKRNYTVFPQHIHILVDEFLCDCVCDKIEIIEKVGEYLK